MQEYTTRKQNTHHSGNTTLGNVSNEDSDVNENGKNEKGLFWQNNNFARKSRFLYISLPSVYDYDEKMPNYCTFVEDVNI